MLARRSDLPLKGDATSRFLPWLVALMTFLAAIAVAGVFSLTGLIERWDHDVSGTLTVQVAPVGGDKGPVLTEERVRAAVALVERQPGILSVQALGKEKLIDLLEPWLGNADVVRDLPLPRLIDVTVDPRRRIDVAHLAEVLGKEVPGASLDDHRVWLSRLINLSRTIEWTAMGIVALIGLVTSATVVYASKTGMAVHYDVVEVLHLIGAQDDYVARQFADRAFTLGFAGGLIGLAMAVPALMAIGWAARRLEGGFLPSLSLPLSGFVVIGLLPVGAAILAMLTARITVHNALARMP